MSENNQAIPPVPGPIYGSLPLEDIHVVRSMGLAEFRGLTPTDGGVEFHAMRNAEKAAANPKIEALAFLEQTGFTGPEAATRNTLHFSANALVSDHVYGTFARDVIAVAPLADNLEKSGPSSFNEVDVAFPFENGKREFKNVAFFVREDLAANLPPGGPAFTTFKPGQEAEVVRDFLSAKGVDLHVAGMHGWTHSAATPSDAKDFAADLGELAGHKVLAGPHAGSAEDNSENVLGRMVASTKSIFEGEMLYEDVSGAELSNRDRAHATLAEMKALQTDAGHPHTKAHLGALVAVSTALVEKTSAFAETFYDFKESGDAKVRERLMEMAPPVCHARLGERLDAIQADLGQGAKAAMPPPLPSADAGGPPPLPGAPHPGFSSSLFSEKMPTLFVAPEKAPAQRSALWEAPKPKGY